MKRQKRKSQKNSKQKIDSVNVNGQNSRKTERRKLLVKFRNVAMAAVVLSGVGWYVVAEVRVTVQEQDLSRIGNGIATVVQIHDPQCPKCVALQREARAALSEFESSELQFLVSNIRSVEGRQFAAKHHVAHVTLLLFDAKGDRREVLVGPNSAENLKRIFRRHLERSK